MTSFSFAETTRRSPRSPRRLLPGPPNRIAGIGQPSVARFDTERLRHPPQTAMTGLGQGEVESSGSNQERLSDSLPSARPRGPYLESTPNNVDGTTPVNSESDKLRHKTKRGERNAKQRKVAPRREKPAYRSDTAAFEMVRRGGLGHTCIMPRPCAFRRRT